MHFFIVTRYLPPIPVPPRSLVVERYPPAPEKPRKRIIFIFLFLFLLSQIVVFFCYLGDIIIERWCPYGPQPERQQIVQPAPPPIKYPAPSHTVIVYDSVQSNIVRKFERLEATQEDPDAYVARYGTPLLAPTTLIQQARNAGVTEDIVKFFWKKPYLQKKNYFHFLL
jgi:hypothetical protein